MSPTDRPAAALSEESGRVLCSSPEYGDCDSLAQLPFAAACHALFPEQCLPNHVNDRFRLHCRPGPMTAAELYGRPSPTPPASSARLVALDLVGAVLRRKRPLDDAIEDHPAMAELPVRDRAFAR